MPRTTVKQTEPVPRAISQNGPAIRAIRQLLGLSVDDLAKTVSVAAPTLRNWENEHRSCAPEVLVIIADALHVDVRAICRDRATFGVIGGAA